MVEVVSLIVISELMYNPASSERLPVQTEWVELYNRGEEAADLSGWYLADEDGQTVPLPKGTIIEPDEAIVLIPADQTVEDFQSAWGKDFAVYRLEQWGRPGISGLANSPSRTNEVLTLRRSDASVADEVNFDDTRPWPADQSQGASIYLAPGKIDVLANDEGKHWRRSKVDKHEGRHCEQTDDYSARDVGSPGVVVIEQDA